MLTLETIETELSIARGAEKKIELLLSGCRLIQYEDPSLAYTYAKRARDIAKKAKLLARDVHCHRMMGICLYAMNDFEGALSIFQQTAKHYTRMKDRTGLSRVHQNIGLALRNLGRTDEAQTAYRESERHLRVLNDIPVLIVVLVNIGALASMQNKPSVALEAYSESLAMAEGTDDAPMRARVMGNIADVYTSLGDFETAIEWSNKSLELHRQATDDVGTGITLSNLAKCYQLSGRIDEALRTSLESVGVMESTGDLSALARSHATLATLYLAKGKVVLAKEYARAALTRFVAVADTDRIVRCYVTLAECALSEKKTLDAQQLLKKAMKHVKDSDNSALQIDVLRMSALLAERNGDLKGAVRHLERSTVLAKKQDLLTELYKLHEALVDLFVKLKDLPQALKHQRLGSTALMQSEQTIRSKHSQALNLRLEFERAQRLRELTEVRNEKLTFDLVSRERELNTKAISIAQKNEMLMRIADGLKDVLDSDEKDRRARVRELIRMVEMHRRTGDEWKRFSEHLADVHDDFLKAVSVAAPNLSPADLRIASLIKLNLTSKEVADMLALSEQSVEVYRSRLRKKLGLAQSDSLVAALQKFGV